MRRFVSYHANEFNKKETDSQLELNWSYLCSSCHRLPADTLDYMSTLVRILWRCIHACIRHYCCCGKIGSQSFRHLKIRFRYNNRFCADVEVNFFPQWWLYVLVLGGTSQIRLHDTTEKTNTPPQNMPAKRPFSILCPVSTASVVGDIHSR